MWSTPRSVSPFTTRSGFEAEELDLRRLLPALGPEPTVSFRTLKGFQFRAVTLSPGAAEATVGRIRRVYEIQPPAGERCYCAVDVTDAVRSMIDRDAGREFPPDHAVWDLVCRTSLCARLWDEADVPPDSLLVYHINREQIDAVRVLVRQPPHTRGRTP